MSSNCTHGGPLRFKYSSTGIPEGISGDKGPQVALKWKLRECCCTAIQCPPWCTPWVFCFFKKVANMPLPWHTLSCCFFKGAAALKQTKEIDLQTGFIFKLFATMLPVNMDFKINLEQCQFSNRLLQVCTKQVFQCNSGCLKEHTKQVLHSYVRSGNYKGC